LGAAADTQRAGLASELEVHRRGVQAELVTHADLLKDIRWTSDGAPAADVLRRLADMARGGQAKVMAIGPLEQESTPRYRKSSHRVDMAVPFRDLLDFATRVEGEGGILEEVVLESARGPRAGDRAGAEDVRAQFRLTTIEPSEEARRIVERVLAASLKKSKSGFAATAIAWWRSRMEKLSSGPPRAARDRRCCRASAPLRRQGDDNAGCRHDRPRPLHGALAGSGTVAGRKLRTATPDRSDDDRSSRSRRTDHPPHARRAVSRQPDRHARGHGRGHRVPLRGAGWRCLRCARQDRRAGLRGA